MSFIGLLLIFFGALGQLLINHSRVVSLIMVLASVLFAFLFCGKKHIWKWFLGSAVINVSGLVDTGWYFFVIPAVWNTFFGIVLLGFGRKAWDIEVFHERERSRRRGSEAERSGEITIPEKRTARRKRTLFRFLSSAGKGFVFVFAALMILMTFVPGIPMGFLRRHVYHTYNVTDAVQRENTEPTGVNRVLDVCYDTEYPNGYLDIIYTPAPVGVDPMTVVYFHGGGFIWGDKESGDPNARSHNAGNNLIGRMTEAGYNVVSMNYALTPEYTFPAAIKQLNHGLRYLKEHAGEWGLNMDAVVFAGFSAGANLEGILAGIQTNPGCAAAFGEEPVLTEQELKGVIFEGCLVDCHRFADTDDYLYDYLFYTMGRLYFRANDLVNNRLAGSCNIMDYVSEDFPPSFISDGNTGTYFRQAAELHAKLKELGVYTELNYYPPEAAGDLWHGFEEEDTIWSEQTMQKILLFLRNISTPS